MALLTPVEQKTKEVFGMVPMEDRLSILPRYSPTQGLIAPQFVYDIAKAVSAPITAARGYQVTPEEAVNTAINAFGGGGLGTAPKGALRTFIGRNAKTWDKAAEAKFLDLEKKGISPEDIWRQTGTLRGFDGKLRQEVSDREAKAFFTNLQESGNKRLSEKAIVNPAVEAAYPQLKNISQLGLRENIPGGSIEQTFSDGNLIGGLLVAKAPTTSAMRGVGVHEMQHGIQGIEGFSPGANLQAMGKAEISEVALKKRNKLLDQALDLYGQDKIAEGKAKEKQASKVLDNARYAAYLRSLGEAEARLSQRRIDLTDAERRMYYPYSRGEYGLDINPKKLRK